MANEAMMKCEMMTQTNSLKLVITPLVIFLKHFVIVVSYRVATLTKMMSRSYIISISINFEIY